MIELRSDTFTRPTAAMRRAMAEAEVGDDIYGEDPTVLALEARAAAMVGKQASCFMPSGTMANLCAIMAHCPRGSKVMAGAETDMYLYEAYGASVCGGVGYAPIPNLPDGRLDPELLAAEFPEDPEDSQLAPPALVCLENTHSRCGGAVLPESYLAEIRALTSAHGIAFHLDGARLFNAAVAAGLPAARIAGYADSVQFCLSKGLSAPIGSMLAGDEGFITAARRVRKMLGGGMRQAGIVAAAGLVALDTMVERLAEDHANAARLAEGLRSIPGMEVQSPPVTNIVMFRLAHGPIGQAEFIARARERGLSMMELGHGRIRAVTHADLSTQDVDTALQIMQDLVSPAFV